VCFAFRPLLDRCPDLLIGFDDLLNTKSDMVSSTILSLSSLLSFAYEHLLYNIAYFYRELNEDFHHVQNYGVVFLSHSNIVLAKHPIDPNWL